MKKVKLFIVFEQSDCDSEWTLMEVFSTKKKAKAYIKKRKDEEKEYMPARLIQHDIIERELL
jgi:hypothetical protein